MVVGDGPLSSGMMLGFIALWKHMLEGGRHGLVSVGRGERVLAAMADAHGSVVRSHAAAVIAVKWVMALASRPYSDK